MRRTDHATPLYPHKLELTSPTSGGRSVGIVRSRTKVTELVGHLPSPRRAFQEHAPHLVITTYARDHEAKIRTGHKCFKWHRSVSLVSLGVASHSGRPSVHASYFSTYLFLSPFLSLFICFLFYIPIVQF
jgi:hypothetical protein